MATFSDIASAEAAVKTHPLCETFVADAHRFIVYYPPRYRIPGGTLADRSAGDLVALNAIYSAMQRIQTA